MKKHLIALFSGIVVAAGAHAATAMMVRNMSDITLPYLTPENIEGTHALMRAVGQAASLDPSKVAVVEYFVRTEDDSKLIGRWINEGKAAGSKLDLRAFIDPKTKELTVESFTEIGKTEIPSKTEIQKATQTQ